MSERIPPFLAALTKKVDVLYEFTQCMGELVAALDEQAELLAETQATLTGMAKLLDTIFAEPEEDTHDGTEKERSKAVH